MPKRNGSTPKKFYQKNSNFNQGVATAGNVARTAGAALAVGKLALSLINPEFKYIDEEATHNSVTTTHILDLLNPLGLGTTSTTRNGTSVKNMSIDIGLLVTRNTASTTNNFVRVVLVLDKHPNAVAPTAANIFQSSAALLSPRNLAFRNRFVFLKDWIIDIGNAGNRPSVHAKLYKKLQLHTTFNTGNSSTIADITENAFYLCMVSDASTNAPNITYWSRIRFLDN